MNYWGMTSLQRMRGVNPDLIECATISLQEMTFCDMTIPWMGGRREATEQNDIYKRGYSQLDGYINESYHQSGNALDIIPYKCEVPELAFYIFATIMFKNWIKKGYKGRLQWGGHWITFKDMPHWQVKYL